MRSRSLLSLALACLLVAAVHAPQAASQDASDEPLESAILARVPALDLRAQVPAGWFGAHLAQRPLEPARRRARLPRRCRTTGGYREHCSGPRLLVEPSGAPAQLAAHLGLGLDQTAMQLLGGRRAFPEWIASAAGLDGERALTYPVPEGRNGRGFGFTRTGSMRHVRHDGLDIQAAGGSSIVAARGGLVAYADNGLSGLGNLLIVLHEDGDTTAYAHCQRILVQPGQVVARGEPIAEVGRTGFAPAPHLHFEWRQNGWNRDPARVLQRRDARPAEPRDDLVTVLSATPGTR